MDKYIPPYDITEEMLELTSEIMELLGELKNVNELEKLPRLRRVSRIKSIHSSLAIENNTLSLQQVTDVIEGKRVLGPQDDIIAVKNAFQTYKVIDEVNPFSIEDLTKMHKIMMNDLVDEAGKIRTSSVGVINQNGDVIHVAPPYQMVKGQLLQLFDWLKTSKPQMLIKSSVFHYEFEFIHPFLDGNGRMGRLWQTALLSNWKPIFKWIPIESIIKDNQEQYYKAISLSTSEGKSNRFILFMLGVIKSALFDIIKDSRKHYSHINNQITALMSVIEAYPMSLTELMEKVGLKSRDTFRKNYILPALEAGLIGMTNPEKPRSKNQKYFKI
ncbi:MAG: Fic family protein [Clostridia bacterium]|nr:Fic family protein [Clostridia bacterium]